MLQHIRMYRQWWKVWGNLPVMAWVRAARLYREGNYAAAALQYQRGIASHPDHDAVWCARLDLGYCFFKLGRLREAEELLRQVTAHAPTLREGHLRLIKVLMWSGRSAQAIWIARRAIKRFGADADLVAAFTFAIAEQRGPAHLWREVAGLLHSLIPPGTESEAKLEVCRALHLLAGEDSAKGRELLAQLVSLAEPPFEAFVSYAELLMRDEGRVAFARQLLRRAQSIQPRHPRVACCFAESYLRSGPFYNPAFAVQNAQLACQLSNWSNPRALHVLAEAFYQNGDNSSALLVAHRAKEEGKALLAEYADSQTLEQLITTLSRSEAS